MREYVLYKRSTFAVTDNQGKILVPANEIVLKRDITYNEQQELSKQAEEVLLYNDMQSDIVQQMLRRMAAAKPAALPTDAGDTPSNPAIKQ